MENLGLWPVLAELKLELMTFRHLELPPRLDDRSLWNSCQEQAWALFTENRNHDGPDSLHATLMDSWQGGHFPVLLPLGVGKQWDTQTPGLGKPMSGEPGRTG